MPTSSPPASSLAEHPGAWLIVAIDDESGLLEVRAASPELGASNGPLAQVLRGPHGRALELEDLRAADRQRIIAIDVVGTHVVLHVTALPRDGLWVLEIDRAETVVDALQDRLDLFAGVLDEATDLYITIVDRGMTLIYVNRAYRESFVFPANFGIGQPLDALLAPETAAELTERYSRIMATGAPEIWEYLTPPAASRSAAARTGPQSPPSGDEPDPRTVLVHSVPIRSTRTSQVVAVANLSLDITDRILAVREAQAAHREAERARHATSELISRISHELRTPLHLMLGFAQLLQGEALDDASAGHAERIMRAGGHLDQLIDDVLEFGRHETAERALALEPVDADAAVQDALDVVAPMAGELDMDVVFAHRSGSLVCADGRRLHQVLINLLTNAIKYNRPRAEVEVALEARAGRVRFSVTDSGPGVVAEDAERIFLPFERSDAGHADGVGLGLSVSRTLAEAMGGTLKLACSSPAGSTFVLELAAVHANAEVRPATRRKATPSLEGVTVLHVDDDAGGELLELILTRAGVTCRLRAATAETAVGLAIARRPDLVLLDAQHPDISGLAVLEALCANPATTTIPVVMATTDTAPDAIRRLLDAGACDVVRKPFGIEHLIAVMHRALTQLPARHERPTVSRGDDSPSLS